MMKPEIAREQLGKLRSEKLSKARMARLHDLPKPLATLGLGLFGLSPDSQKQTPPDYTLRHKLKIRSYAKLDTDSKSRAKIFAVLFPTLGEVIESGWQLLGSLPYTYGYTRRGFRAPNRPRLYLQNRQSYFEAVHDQLTSLPDDTLNPAWIASWANYLGYRSNSFGYLLAGVINTGGAVGDEVFTILKDSAANRHEIGGPGGHATRGLLCCNRPEAWEFMEKLLLVAQRQEGLRQVILESVDEAHPEALRRMIALVLDHNLIRFASVARAAGVWLGRQQEVENPKQLKADLTSCQELLADPGARLKAIEKGDPLTAYMGLWASAAVDAEDALKRAIPLFSDKKPERRFLAAKFAWETGLPEVTRPMLQLLDDSDMRLVAVSVSYFRGCSSTDPDDEDLDENDILARHPKDLFERIEKLIPNLPAKAKETLVTVEGWPVPTISQEIGADLLLTCLQSRKPERLLPYLPMMGQYSRVRALGLLCEARTISSEVRELLIAFAGEPNHYIREAALGHLKKLKITESEVQKLESYLTRKAADFRRAVYELLLTRSDKLMLSTVDRLLLAGDANSRGAGIELARRLVDANRSAEPVRKRLVAYKETKGKRLPTAEADAIEIILNPAARPPSLENGLGTFNPDDCCPVMAPAKKKVAFYSTAATSLLKSLDELIHTHRAATYVSTQHNNQKVEFVLGSITYRWAFPSPNDKLDVTADRANLPLLEIWEDWWQNRSRALRDSDGLELIRAIYQPTVQARDGEQDIPEDDDEDDDEISAKSKAKPSAARIAYQTTLKQLAAPSIVKLRYEALVNALLGWFLKLYPPAGVSEFLLDAAETQLATIPAELIDVLKPRKLDADPPEEPSQVNDPDEDLQGWRESTELTSWLTAATSRHTAPDWTPAHTARLWRLYRWRDQPRPGVNRLRPEWSILLAAYPSGGATITDIYDHLIGPRSVTRYYWSRSFESLRYLTSSSPARLPNEIREAVTTVVNRVIECELNRGETPIASSQPANDIQQVHGLSNLIRLLAGLGKAGFSKVDRYSASQNKPAVLTHLIKATVPDAEETPEIFAKAVQAAVAEGLFPIERIVEFGLVNPRWVKHVERAIAWKGYEEAVYWLIAHTESSWGNLLGAEEEEVDEDDETPPEPTPDALVKKETPWQAIVRARTSLTAEQRADGLVDVQWFHTAYQAVGSRRHWDAIEEAAKFLGYGQSHKKATRLADVLLGHTKRKDLVADIRTKFLKESVKLLGLLPLPADPAKLETELAERYRVLKEYERYARGLSSLSKEPALQAARLGMENLAVTAGYGDPVRLEWAVTAREVAVVAEGKVSAKVGAITTTLTLSPEGEADLIFTQGDKTITKLPADVRKNPKVAELIERKKQLLRTLSSTKRALEQAMCSGSRFTAAELKTLMSHPLVRPLLERLVLITPSGLGYPNASGTSLKVPGGKAISVKAKDTWGIAHPLDLLASGDWPMWQADCFKVERVQPFKQLFREVYVPTAAEKEDPTCSRRYSGQQVNTTQANALFSTRGWSTREGIVKLFRDAGLIAMVTFDHGYTTPADAAAPAVRQLDFHRRGDWKAVPIPDVPPVILSEVLRDLDLVVSVAHVGGVDPEATQSTIEMRAALLNTTFGFLKVKNVTIDGRHALIRGEYGHYSVHLGSGVVHKQPGGSLCVVPVNAQHRGRLFLPFADDDPRTAEVVSKVLLLARDKEIQDPTILDQIVNR